MANHNPQTTPHNPITIGFDASRASVAQRTGTENYSLILLREMVHLAPKDHFRLYARQSLDGLSLEASNVEQKIIAWPRLWTQAGLAIEAILQKPDVLFIPAHTMPVIHRPSLKTVVTIHDLGAEFLPQYHQFPHKLYLNRATEFAAAHATHLIAVSEFTKQDLVNKLHVDPARVSVIYEGVDLDANRRPPEAEIRTVKTKYRLDRPYILFVGTIQPRKNLTRLIESFSHIKDQDVDLVLAGGKGWLSEEIYEAPAKYKVESRVKFLGYITDQERVALYAGAQASALVSVFEGFGLPLLESMAVGTPVIAANATSLPEVAGEAGLLVDPYNIEDMTAGLDRIISDQALRQQYIQAGYQQAAKFSWTTAAQQTLDLLRRIATS